MNKCPKNSLLLPNVHPPHHDASPIFPPHLLSFKSIPNFSKFSQHTHITKSDHAISTNCIHNQGSVQTSVFVSNHSQDSLFSIRMLNLLEAEDQAREREVTTDFAIPTSLHSPIIPCRFLHFEREWGRFLLSKQPLD